MKMVHVTHNSGEYPVLIGERIIEHSSTLQIIQTLIAGPQVFILTDHTVAQHYLSHIQKILRHLQCHHLLLPEGDQAKTITTFTDIMDVCIAKQLHRDMTFVALGGGAVGDITGFTAACYQRGVRWINFPTTLLAQVDASIGGKTAINHHRCKNMIGAFHPPSAVVIDIATLRTLPDREFRAGIAEIIKIALILDADFFAWLEQHMPAMLARDSTAVLFAIQKACELKRTIVMQDEREHNVRALLNLGHTFAHAMEASSEFEGWLHGEAVALGIVLAARLSHQLGMLDALSLTRIHTLISHHHLLRPLPDLFSPKELRSCMNLDKKIKGNQHRLILLCAIGQGVIHTQTSAEMMCDLLNQNVLQLM